MIRGWTYNAYERQNSSSVLITWLYLLYKVGLLLNKEQLKEEIRILERSLKVKNQLAALQRYEYFLSQKKRDSIDPDLFSQNELIFLLMKWCRVVCAFYDIKVICKTWNYIVVLYSMSFAGVLCVQLLWNQ